MTASSPTLPPITDARTLVRGLGRWVRNTRTLLGLSQETLASLAHTSQGAISRLEAGRSLDTPLMTYVKVVGALSQEIVLFRSVVPLAPYVADALAFASYMTPHGDFPPPISDAAFSTFLAHYASLSPANRQVYLTLTLPLVEYLSAKRSDDGQEQEFHQGSDQEARGAAQRPRGAAGEEDPRVEDRGGSEEAGEGGPARPLRPDVGRST